LDAHAQYVAALLGSARQAYAAGAVLRLSAQEAGGVAQFGDAGFRKLQNLATGLIDHLQQSVLVDRPALYEHEVGWVKQVFAARKLDVPVVRDLLGAIRDELAEELPASAASTAVPVAEAGRRHFEVAPDEPPSPLEGTGPLDEIARRYLVAAFEGRRLDALRVVEEALAGGMTIPALYADVLMRAQIEIGRMWQLDVIHVAEEHMSSRITEQVMSIVSARMKRKPKIGKRVLITTASGDLHDIGVRMVADHFELEGWDVLYLGASTPAEDVAETVQEYGVDLVGVAAKLVLHVGPAAELIDAVRRAMPERHVPILVGGFPFQLVPGLWRVVGADGEAPNAVEAVRVGEMLTARVA